MSEPQSDVRPESSMNPYAVGASVVEDDVRHESYRGESGAGPPGTFDRDVVTSKGMLMSAIGFTSLSGMFFGGAIASAVGLVAVMNRAGVLEFLLLVLFGTIAGGCLALLSSVPVAFALLCFVRAMDRPHGCWTPRTMRLMHIGTGAFSGAVPPLVAGWLSVSGILFSFVPALVGGFISGILGERKIRRARTYQREIRDQPANGASDDSAGRFLRDRDPLVADGTTLPLGEPQ
ncbi:MAG: hypothetical protein AAF989_09190 [Planctomycetota bacterium]